LSQIPIPHQRHENLAVENHVPEELLLLHCPTQAPGLNQLLSVSAFLMEAAGLPSRIVLQKVKLAGLLKLHLRQTNKDFLWQS
jgi:hypothetical protein